MRYIIFNWTIEQKPLLTGNNLSDDGHRWFTGFSIPGFILSAYTELVLHALGQTLHLVAQLSHGPLGGSDPAHHILLLLLNTVACDITSSIICWPPPCHCDRLSLNVSYLWFSWWAGGTCTQKRHVIVTIMTQIKYTLISFHINVFTNKQNRMYHIYRPS